MEWTKLLSKMRLGREDEKIIKRLERSEFQTDFDRIVFSTAFRRLQNKTQVVPLPKTDFVHTRLTHSLEASCVGRSLGRIVALEMIRQKDDLKKEFDEINITPDDIGALVATACLAHDIGNPPFGHSGEDAISEFFRSKKANNFLDGLSEKQIADVQNFEGNSVGFRLLTNSFPAISSIPGGMGLTYATLGTIVKYPKESLPNLSHTGNISEKKFGFFQSEANVFSSIAERIGLVRKNIDNCLAWYRHPLSFLVEAADDICYKIVDLEDAYKMHLIDFNTIKNLLCDIIASRENSNTKKIEMLNDEIEKIGYLRSKAIGTLVEAVAEKFIENYNEIMNCKLDKPLLDEISAKESLSHLMRISVERIYNSQPVVEVESAGFEVLSGLLDSFLNSIFESQSKYYKKIIRFIPNQYLDKGRKKFEDKYTNILNIAMFVAGMTDTIAVDTYRCIKGISLPTY